MDQLVKSITDIPQSTEHRGTGESEFKTGRSLAQPAFQGSCLSPLELTEEEEEHLRVPNPGKACNNDRIDAGTGTVLPKTNNISPGSCGEVHCGAG